MASTNILHAVIADFLPAYSHPVDGDSFRRLLNPALNNAKSSNHVVRAGSIALFKVLIKLNSSSADLEHTVTEVLSLPKAGKTAGPDHRLALYTMLGSIPPSEPVSSQIVQTGLSLLAKETHDASVSALGSSLIPHLVHSLRAASLPSDIASVAAKEMTNAKPVVRRAFCSLVGSALWELGNIDTTASITLAKAVLPSFETNLKTVSGNPLGAVAGPLEGYVATAILLGPFARSKQFGSFSSLIFVMFVPYDPSLPDDVISHNATLQSIFTAHPKPSFLLWDKVYQKLSGEEEETWLLRASEAALAFSKDEVLKNEHTRFVYPAAIVRDDVLIT